MDAAAISRLISLIPDRSARTLSGSVFAPSEAAACRYPERMSYLNKFLHWMGPLETMTREDQVILGVRTSGGRPAGEAGLEDGAEEGGDEALEALEADELDGLDAGPAAETGTPIAQPAQPSMVGG